LLPIASGQVRIRGDEPSRAVLEGCIGYLPERPAYPDYLTPQKLLSHYGKLSGIEKGDLGSQVDGCIEQCGLGKVANQRIGKLSKGALQKLAMAQALIHDPTVLLLDEPMDGLDPLARKHAFRLIRTLKDEGKTVLLATHLIDGLEHCCDQLLILDRGRVIFQGPPAFEAGLEAWLVDRLHKQEAVYE
jgi:ABC-2 type transport system ATP-binding protein